jgi:hypothetical protein
VASWFETREGALLTMRGWLRAAYENLILRSIAKRCVSKVEAIEVEIAKAERRTPLFRDAPCAPE